MNLENYLDKYHILILPAADKMTVFTRLIDCLVKATPWLNAKNLEKAIIAREEQMSTGIGNGLAIPHVRLDDINDPILAMAVIPDGVKDYETLDDTPVSITVMIIAPEGNHEAYLKLLAKTADALKDEGIREQIITAQTPEAIIKLLESTQQ